MAITVLNLLVIPVGLVFSEQAYCPQGHAFIQLGMTESEILSACGKPTQQMKSPQAATERIPVTQLIYSSISQVNPYPGQVNAMSNNWYPGLTNIFNQWSLPTATNEAFKLEVDIVNNKVTSIRMNGGGTNALTMCPGRPIQVGDDINDVYSSCGSPETTNTTYKNVVIPSKEKPVIWIYEVDQYSPNLRLTFIDGKLQSID